MKKNTILFALVLFILNTQAQTINNLYKDEKGTEKLLGEINKKGLTTNSFNNWFSKNYKDYQVNDKIVSQLKDSLKNYKIQAFIGTWCGDSKKELPPLYKVLEAANFSEKNLKVIAVDRTSKAYKQSPNGEEKGLNIHRVPTFIFYKDGKEVSRIVEHPKETIERDIHKIVSKQRYSPNYVAVTYLERLLIKKGLDSLRFMEKELIPVLAEYTKGSRELNTYGYIKLRAHEIEKAIYIFKLNTKIFPYKHNVFDSLGEAYFEAKNYPEALKNYYKVLTIKPNNENALKMIEKIKNIQNKAITN